MNGGASHIDTFDPKPSQTEFGTIPTETPGLHFAEHLPTLAKLSKEMAVIRSMSTSEGSHARARYYIHTGYREGVGGVVHPTLGSIMSATIGVKKPELPNFVSISGGGLGPGFLGPVHAPLHVNDPNKGIDNLKPVDAFDQFDDKASVLAQMEQSFLERKQTPAAVAHQATYEAAVKLMHSEKAKRLRSQQGERIVRQDVWLIKIRPRVPARSPARRVRRSVRRSRHGGLGHAQGQLRPSEEPEHPARSGNGRTHRRP